MTENGNFLNVVLLPEVEQTKIVGLINDEVLQPSSLSSYKWPDSDPSVARQKTRQRTNGDFDNVLKASTNVNIDWEMFEKNHRNQTLPQRVLDLLANSKFNFNTRTQILEEAIWLERITKSINKNEPICIVYPLFCKIGNWAKQMYNIGPNAGDEATILFFLHINDIIKKIYAPGIRIIIATDAQLYNSAFQNTEVETAAYISQCRKLIKDHDREHAIDFINYVDLLADNSVEYMHLHRHFQNELLYNRENVLKGINVDGLFQSVKASINTRMFKMEYKDHKEIFGNIPNNANSYYSIIDQKARAAFDEVICIRKTCGELNIFEKIFPNNVRVTCHKGLKNGIAVIGLRPYPEYYGSSKLLPYHGVPIISNSKHGLKLDIQPEVMLRGRLDLVRVINDIGHTYYYDATQD